MHRFTTKAKKRRVLLAKYFPFPLSFPLSCLFFFGCLRWNKKFAHIKLKSPSSSKLPRSFASLFSRKKSQTLAFKDYYTIWFNTLQKPLLPLIHKSLSSSSSQTLLYSHVELLLSHFLSYCDALNNAATHENLPDPSWRNSLEIPFRFLGNLHP